MATNRPAEIDYNECINLVKRYIRKHVAEPFTDETLNRERLATLAGFSVPHFHRLFTAHAGETVAQYVRRARMERAARQLLNPATQVTDVAFAHGYETHSAFSKAFKQTFGISPTQFRQLNRTGAAHLLNRHIPYNRKDLEMQPEEIRTLPNMNVLYARASEMMTEPAFQTAPQEAFDKLMNYVMANHAMEETRHVIAIYPDACEVGQNARFDAGVIFTDGVEEPAAPDGLAYQTLAGGRWAIFRHTGPYDNLWQTWQRIYRDWLPTSGEKLRDVLCFEDYVNNPGEVSPEELITEIYVPIQ